MKVRSPTLVTVTVPPRNGVENAPGALAGAAWTTDNFQNGLLVCGTMAMAEVPEDRSHICSDREAEQRDLKK